MKFDEALIEAVREEPVLYDETMASYRQEEKIAIAWRRLSRKLGVDGGKCQTRWKTLRDRYFHEQHLKEHFSGTVLRKEFEYLDRLRFLEDYLMDMNTSDDKKKDDLVVNMSAFMTIINDTPNYIHLEVESLSEISTQTSTKNKSIVENKSNAETKSNSEEKSNGTHFQLDSYITKNEGITLESIYFKYLSKYVQSKHLSDDQFMELQTKISRFIAHEIDNIKSK